MKTTLCCDRETSDFVDGDGFPLSFLSSCSSKSMPRDDEATWGMTVSPPVDGDDDSMWDANDDFSVSVYKWDTAPPINTSDRGTAIGGIDVATEPSGSQTTGIRNRQPQYGNTVVTKTQCVWHQDQENLHSVPFSPTARKHQSSAPPLDNVWNESGSLSPGNDGFGHVDLSPVRFDDVFFTSQRGRTNKDEHSEFSKNGNPESPDVKNHKFNKSLGDIPSFPFEAMLSPLTPLSGSYEASTKKRRDGSSGKAAVASRSSRRDGSVDQEKSADRGRSIPAEKSHKKNDSGNESSRSRGVSSRGERLRDRSLPRGGPNDKLMKRSRSTGPVDGRTDPRRNRERSCRRDASVEQSSGSRRNMIPKSPVQTAPLSRSAASNKDSRRPRISERRVPQRCKSDDDIKLFHSSLQDLAALGVSIETKPIYSSVSQALLRSGSTTRKAPRRTQSMNVSGTGQLHRLQDGLRLLDHNSSSSKRNRRKGDDKSLSTASVSTSTASTESRPRTKRYSNYGMDNSSPSQEEDSTLRKREQHEKPILRDSDQEMFRGRKENFSVKTPSTNGFSKEPHIGSDSDDRRQTDMVNLVREKRKAEEAKLKRLQEEGRLLEEKRLMEEMRIEALQAERKLLEEKRLEEEARLRVEAKIAEERRKAEEMKIRRQLEQTRQQRIEEEERIARLREEALSIQAKASTNNDDVTHQQATNPEEASRSVTIEDGKSCESGSRGSVEIAASSDTKEPSAIGQDNAHTHTATDSENETGNQFDIVEPEKSQVSEMLVLQTHVEDKSLSENVSPPEVRPGVKGTMSVTQRIARFRAPSEDVQLPPAFQLIRDQAKRLQKK